MRVVRVASTRLSEGPRVGLAVGEWLDVEPYYTSDEDFLGEFGGRLCYQSWGRPNAKTAGNKSYLGNIIEQGHFSVLEHVSVTYMVESVSRSLLTELTRHRHISLSVRSQRYVDESAADFIVPPVIRDMEDSETKSIFDEITESSKEAYIRLVDLLVGKGSKRKIAREAARSVLPNATETSFIVTGNLRSWRDVLGKRYHPAADAEIREFAGLVLEDLKSVAPNSFQDFEVE